MLTQLSIQKYMNHLAATAASPNTIRAYSADLSQLNIWINQPEHEIAKFTWDQTEGVAALWVGEMTYRAPWSPKTIERKLGTLRSWAAWAGCPRRFLNSYRNPKPAPPEPHPIPEGVPGVVAMIKSTRNPKHRALCALTGLLGLRVNEAINVKGADFRIVPNPDPTQPNVITLTVMGKGNRQRRVPVSPTVYQYIERAHMDAGAGRLVPLGNRGARAAITRHARNAGLVAHVSSHDMRATFATAAYERSHDLRAVQELLGHSDAKTTQVYTKISEQAMRHAASVI